MKHLSIVVPDGDPNMSSIVGSLKIFSKMNEYVCSKGLPKVFTVDLVGSGKEVTAFDGLFTIHPNRVLDDVKRTDLIIIPAFKGDHRKTVEKNQPLTNWIFGQYKSGAEIACICSGVAILAATGLLKNKKCAIHWMLAEKFKTVFPDVHWVADRIMTDEQGIYTNGGGYSFLNLLLHLVEKYYGRETAVYCSKFFQIDIHRHSQSPFIIFSGQKDHEDQSIREAQTYIEQNIHQKIPVEELASRFTSGKRNFDRRFRRATSNSPAEYIQRVKIEAARKSLESGRKNVSEVMYDVGYTDIKAFRGVFKKITGLSPVEYKNRYSRM